MLILAFDCATNLCAACVWDAEFGRERGRSVRDLGKGHAEHLMAVIGEALAAGQASLKQVGAIGVGVGPGSFTGIRVAVSAARGLALALGIPAAGVSTLEAIAAEARPLAADLPVAAVQDGGQGLYQLGIYDKLGRSLHTPLVAAGGEAASMVKASEAMLAGPGAAPLAALTGLDARLILPYRSAPDIATLARIVAARGRAPASPPAPLYLRAPDAKPQSGFVLPRRDDP